MKKLTALSPKSEISGRLVLAFTQNLKWEEIKPILEKYNLEPTDPDAWYPQQDLLDLFRSIQNEEFNVTENLIAIGMKGSETASYPPEINSIETAIGALPAIHELNHRNIPDVGLEYKVEVLGDHHLQVTNGSPYPNDTLYGFVWGIANLFKPANGKFKLSVLDPSAEDAIFDLTWTDN